MEHMHFLQGKDELTNAEVSRISAQNSKRNVIKIDVELLSI
jgi:hypothetical protein